MMLLTTWWVSYGKDYISLHLQRFVSNLINNQFCGLKKLLQNNPAVLISLTKQTCLTLLKLVNTVEIGSFMSYWLQVFVT